MTLTEFLQARITEDEDEAQPWTCDCAIPGLPLIHGLRCKERVLAECEAKRQILETREKLNRVLAIDDPLGMHNDGGQLYTLDWVLQRLALPHADHPDYQPDWRP